VIGLYRVGEPESKRNVAPISPDSSEMLWKITMQNFPTTLGEATPADLEVVVLISKPWPEIQNEVVDLPAFEHPTTALYVIGPDSADLKPAMLPPETWTHPIHFVHIPLPSVYSLWGHVAWAVVWWDRYKKDQHKRTRAEDDGPNYEGDESG